MEHSVETIRKAWSSRRPGLIASDGLRETAVVLPLLEQEGELSVLFEVRSGKLRSQPGEVCFPGGAVEQSETPSQAAVRETVEELLVRREQIEVVAPLDILHTPANLTVWPYLAFLKGYEGTFSQAEVERVFTVPLTWFLEHEPEAYDTKVVTVPGEEFPYERIPGGRQYHWREGHYKVFFYQYGDAVIWGMTAKILHSFIEMYRGTVHGVNSNYTGKNVLE